MKQCVPRTAEIDKCVAKRTDRSNACRSGSSNAEQMNGSMGDKRTKAKSRDAGRSTDQLNEAREADHRSTDRMKQRGTDGPKNRQRIMAAG